MFESLQSKNKWTPRIEWSNPEVKESINFFGTNENDVIRKLGSAELIYEYEMKTKGMILPFTILFESKKKLFEYKEKIESAINSWKNVHPFLCAKILTKPDPVHLEFSRERYFVYASKEKIKSVDNVKYITVKDGNWMRFHEEELNSDPVDSKNGLLWRLMFLEINELEYCMIFTVHHSIIDGRNAPILLQQLLDFIEKSIKNERINETLIPIDVSIDEKLFKNSQAEMKNIKLNMEYDVPQEDRIPKEFKLNECCESQSKFKSFTIPTDKFKQLYTKSKENGAKMAGCLNIVTALAILELYKEFKCDESYLKKIYFHMMANLRPLLKIDNLTMGFWPVVMNGFMNSEEILNQTIDMEFLKKNFWTLAKKESDSIHKRIADNELYQNAKLGNFLLDLLDMGCKFENGGVHFASSNIGQVDMYNLDLFNITQIYFSVSCNPNRWSAVNFHSICTVKDTLCWGITYNSNNYDDYVIDLLVKKILFIIDCVCAF